MCGSNDSFYKEKEKWIHAGGKGFHPTPPTPKKYRDRSAVSKPTAIEVGSD